MRFGKFYAIIIALCLTTTARGQDIEVDILELFLGLEGKWRGDLVLEQGGEPSLNVKYDLKATGSDGQSLIQEHRFQFPEGIVSAVEVLTYDQEAETLFISYFNARKRYTTDLKVTSANFGGDESWRVLTEHEETYGETQVGIRNLYQLDGQVFTKFRWVKDGEDYILSDSVTLQRIK